MIFMLCVILAFVHWIELCVFYVLNCFSVVECVLASCIVDVPLQTFSHVLLMITHSENVTLLPEALFFPHSMFSLLWLSILPFHLIDLLLSHVVFAESKWTSVLTPCTCLIVLFPVFPSTVACRSSRCCGELISHTTWLRGYWPRYCYLSSRINTH